MIVLRHGDLLLKSDEGIVIPKGSKSLKTDVLAEGEATGHTHRLVGQAQILEHEAADGTVEKFVDAKQDSQLVHQEHNTIDIPKGVYRVVQEREFDVIEQMSKEVYD
ncbi:MAG: hypothetical protein CL880_01085 [Dehalococcoidia bacterium]|nr:hypothetical protein [Dehalococcoidia bacterium]|tara:strand:- start:343 stop:663 length:321 start_codon:yes stop_codon:yes gene_type:complete